MKKTVVIDVVALTQSLLGKDTPRLASFIKKGSLSTIKPMLPAVTCSVQSTYLTGAKPEKHGIVGNGWYFKEEAEIKFWRQSNKLVQHLKIWETAKGLDPSFTCANMFWWYNMNSEADFLVTPRPVYLVNGQKIPDVYTKPGEIRKEIQQDLGQFPLFNFWGPASSIKSSQWIADASKWIEEKYRPTLTLIYLPHLDYCLQKYGPNKKLIAKDLEQIDKICGELIDFYEKKGAQVIVLSEYGIMPVSRPIHINRILRENGFLAVREEQGHEMLDPEASIAFAVADHQIAHIYINDSSKKAKIAKLLRGTKGIEAVLDSRGKKEYGIDHPRSGDLVVVAETNAWFTYYFWLDDKRAPDFAKLVEIHKKPGYDPVELFIDPKIKIPMLSVGWRILKRKLGFQSIMDVIPLDATLVKGSHGATPAFLKNYPIIMTDQKDFLKKKMIDAAEVYKIILNHLGE